MYSEASSQLTELQSLAHQALICGDYSQALSLYEQVIEEEASITSNYWYMGLVLLLQGKEEEAQTAWFLAMAEMEPEQVEACTNELLNILKNEAERQSSLEEYKTAWLIRQHIREIAPSDINNLLEIVCLSVQLETFSAEDLKSFAVVDLLKSPKLLNQALLLNTLQVVLECEPLHPATISLAKACLLAAENPHPVVDIVMLAAVKIGYSFGQVKVAARLAELCAEVLPEDIRPLGHLSAFYQKAGDYDKGIETARRFCDLAESLATKIHGNYLLLRGLTSAGGVWDETYKVFAQHQALLLELCKSHPVDLAPDQISCLLTSTFFFPYLQDHPRQNRLFHNCVNELAQINLHKHVPTLVTQYKDRHNSIPQISRGTNKTLSIGYLSAYLKRHSVGWLARWLFQYHDRNQFQVHSYFINQPKDDQYTQAWFVEKSFQSHHLGVNSLEIAEQIYQDQIDILVDLDSITLDVTCEVMALKPAPIQATWLGWDASGIPSIDYFIADPYVLPDIAQEYYTEKIWRLPETYIAVDGFEIGVPTLRRDQLDIPSNAVIYLSAQKGHKRHPDAVKLQMKILKQVPNSYFLIKGTADEISIKNFFQQIAEEEGVDLDRLRFLPEVSSEAVHRANLGIADVVLDTYPYNGATTTLETLWMGIPLVTRVGEQFVSRNSYTMMMNIGVTEGIAWTDEEYVEWGVRLGKDAALRQQISWKMRASRQTSPLWNAKQFTREMENAYEQMWLRYIESK